jgi:hypothetical protein
MNWKGVGGNSRRLIEVLPQNLPGGTEENHEKPQSWYPVSQLTFELSTSQIEYWNIITIPTFSTAVISFNNINSCFFFVTGNSMFSVR